MTSANKIIWLTNHFNYYNDYLYAQLNKEAGIDLHVYHRKWVLESHPWSLEKDLDYNSFLLKESSLGFDVKMIKQSIRSKDYFVIAGWNCLTYILVISILTIRNRPFAIFTDTPALHPPSWFQTVKKIWFKWIFRTRSKAMLLTTGEIGRKNAWEALEIPIRKSVNFPFVTNRQIFYFNEGPGKKPMENVLFLSVGRIDFKHKGQDIAVAACKRLTEDGVHNFTYFIIGKGPDDEALTSMISKNNLNKHVKFIGWKEISEIADWFRKVHFTIHSSGVDPFPNVVLESQSCGTPVIGSTLAGSVKERVIDGINGFVHDAGNVNQLEDKMKLAISVTEDKYLEMRFRNKETADFWNVDYNIKTIKNLLKAAT